MGKILIKLINPDFYIPTSEKEQKKLSKKFKFLKQELGEYTYDEKFIDHEDPNFDGTLEYQIIAMRIRLQRLKRAKKIIEIFNSKERNNDVKLRIDLNNGRFNLRFGHKNKRTLAQLDT